MKKYLITIMLVALSLPCFAKSPVAQIYPVVGYISPNKSEFSPQSNIALFYLNGVDSKYSLTYEISIYKWSDKGLEPTEDLMVFPPIKKVEIGKKYPIKVISKIARSDIQQSYRVVFTQKELVDPNNASTVAIPFSFSVPLFIEPLAKKTVDIQYEYLNDETVITNHGNSMFRTATISVNNELVNQLTYILPNQTIKIKGKVVLGKEY